MGMLRPGPGARSGSRSYLVVSFATVTVLGMLSAATPPRMLTFGMLALGPALAAVSANPSAVLALGGYALAAGFAVSTWQGLLGSLDQVLRLLVMTAITVISWATARHHRALLDAAAESAREREMLAAVTEQSSDAVVSISLDGLITSWNRGAEDLYGYAAEEIVGASLTRLFPPGRRTDLDRILGELATGRRLRFDETRRLRRDGSEVLVSAAVSPIRDVTGRVAAAAVTERDITERKRREAEERLASERSARDARMASLGQLAGGVAHDFNNLLAIILNYADLLAEEVTPEGAADLARIRGAADRARVLTGQLLLFAKREPVQVEAVDLNDVVTEAGELLGRSIGATVRLTCRTHPRPVTVQANRGRLDQILLNLVVNARDAMPDGGDVTIETDVVEVPAGRSAPVPPGGYARLTVGDTGTGMTPEVRNRLFEPFFTTKPADRGTGLGLATVFGIVTDTGGHIDVESAPGVGTTFVILLPLAPGPAAGEPGRGAGGGASDAEPATPVPQEA